MHGGSWERTIVTAEQCERISAEFLAEERRTLGEMIYRQEYMCEFVQNDEQVFPTEIIAAAFTDQVTPLWR